MFAPMIGAVVVAPAAIDLVVIAVALLAILLLLSIHLIVWLIQKMLEPLANIPVLNKLSDAANWLEQAVGNAVNWLWQNANPFKLIGQAWGWFMQHIWDPVTHFANEALQAVTRVVTVTIPQALGHALSVALAWFNQLTAELRAVQQWAAQELNALQNWAAAELNALRNALVAYITAEVAAVQTWAMQLITSVYNTLTAFVLQCVAGLQREVVGIEQGLEQEIAGVAAGAEAEAQALGRWAQQELNGLRADVDGVLQGIEGNLGAAMLTLAGLVPVVRVLDQAFNQYLRDCGKPLCNNLSGLSNDLNLLAGSFDLAAIIGLVALAVKEPQALSDAFNDIIVAPVESAVSDIMGAAA